MQSQEAMLETKHLIYYLEGVKSTHLNRMNGIPIQVGPIDILEQLEGARGNNFNLVKVQMESVQVQLHFQTRSTCGLW